MKYGITHLSQISMRKEPTHKAQLVSQLLFGDLYQIEEFIGDWLRIRILECNYEGFIEKKVWNEISENDATEYVSQPKYFVNDYLIFIKDIKSNITFPVFMGSSFPYPHDNTLILGNSMFLVELPKEQKYQKYSMLSETQDILLQFAMKFLQAPYLWGGRTPVGIDCSALVQLAFKSISILLPRDASQQVNCGTQIDFSTEWQVGDVAFFDNEDKEITHVGILCGKDKILHASGFVKIDHLDSTGIYNKLLEQYTHKLRIVKRLIPNY